MPSHTKNSYHDLNRAARTGGSSSFSMRDCCVIIARLHKIVYNKSMFNPKYNLTDNVVSMLVSIAESKAIIERAKLLPKNEVRLRRQALIRMTHSSTEIEGNMLNLQQVENLFADKKIDAPERDIYEVQNYIKALKYIASVVGNKKPITVATLLKIHSLVTYKTLPKEQSGYFRKCPIYIVRRRISMPDEVVYTGPPAKNVPGLCKDLVDWLDNSKNDGINPVLVAGIVHQEVAAIHPFADGNGRTARAMATLVLYDRGYDFRRLFALEDYYNEDRASYYQAINIGRNFEERRNDSTTWLEYFIKGFKTEIDLVKSQVTNLSLRKLGNKIESKVFLDKEQMLILDFIDQMGRITTSDVMDILKTPKRTAQSKLLKLKDLGIIDQIGKGPSSAYVLK